MRAFFSHSPKEPGEGECCEHGNERRKNDITECESIRELIYEVYLPSALQIGVDYALFWRLTPKKLEPFLKAYESRQKEQLEFINIAGWVNGMYAGCSLSAAFGENAQYPEKPVQIFQSEEDVQENTEREAEYFSAYAAMFNKQFEEKGGNPSCSNANIP